MDEGKPALKNKRGALKESSQEAVLVIDDDADVRNLLKGILERRGFFVTTANDGEDGLSRIMNSAIRIVLCDIMMPKINGLEFLRKVHEHNLSVEIVMITGQSSLDSCVESIERGACAYLIKPVQVSDIFEAIARAQRNIREKQEMIKKILRR